MEQRKFSTNCRFCGRQCHILAEVDEQGMVCKIHPDSEYHTIWCATGRNGLELMNHPDRVRVPLRRAGEKGENKWKEISWEEAFSEIGRQFRKAVDEYGPNAFLGIRGFNKPYFNLIYERWMNTIGTVNSMGAANMCHAARMNAARDTFGFMPNPQITDETRFIVLWGSNPYNTEKQLAAKIQAACQKGTKLIVIDPCFTRHAKQADVWLPIRPGTDMALALGFMNIMIQKQWYDETLIEKNVNGFEKLSEYVAPYTLEETAKITHLDAALIEKTARMIAIDGPGIINIGNAMDHNMDSYQKCRAINTLIAISGNVDRRGALTNRDPMSDKQKQQRKHITRAEFCPYNRQEKREQIVGYKDSYLKGFNESSGKQLADTLNTEKPYPVKAAYVQGGNPAMIWEDREELVKSFLKLDFMVVSDFFITPTAMLADIILPAAVYMEYESVKIDALDHIYYCPNLVPDATAKSDLELINEMAKAMGYEEFFWPTMEEYWNEFLKPYGVTMEQVRKEKKILSGEDRKEHVYGQFREKGFPTQSGKIELYTEEKPLFDIYVSPSEDYPYLSTNYKSEYFYHTAGRQMEGQRSKEPEAIAFLSSDIAQTKGIQEGEQIVVFTEAGSVLQKAHIEENMASGTVALAHGWWYPEKETSPFVLSACSNNIVFSDRYIGTKLPSFTTRGLPCNVKKYTEEL